MFRIIALLAPLACSLLHATSHAQGLAERPTLSIHAVAWDEDAFWGKRLAACCTGTLPTLTKYMEGNERSHFLENFRIAAGLAAGDHRGAEWNDGDTYKWVEALASAWAQSGDPAHKRSIDQAIDVIARAQRPDGYLHTPILIRNLAQQRAGQPLSPPFSKLAGFEMYNFGHLMTAACAHYDATGERSLLNIAIAAAGFLERWFAAPEHQTGRQAICPSHFMGLMELYRTTQDARYLKLATKLLHLRDRITGGGDDNQDRVPLRSHRDAVGHAVRANYLYAGVADLLQSSPDEELWTAIESCWTSVQQRKLSITGGCGALYDGASPDGSRDQQQIARVHQAYGRNFQLPHSTAHNETCAAIGYVLWSYRMWQLTGHGQYIDALENSLYNAVLAGVSLDGKSFFYTNTLRQLDSMPTELRWSRTRQSWISCYCCPPNVARTIAATNRYAYSTSPDQVSVLLYGSNRLTTTLPDGQRLSIKQTANYPADGHIQLRVKAAPSQAYTVTCRIPAWCEQFSITINGQTIDATVEHGFVHVKRVWQPEDLLTLELAMPVRLMAANELVEECRGQVAVMRGPLVYCAEQHDLPSQTSILAVALAADEPWQVKSERGTLDGASLLTGRLLVNKAAQPQKSLYREYTVPRWTAVESQLVPYYAWGNRPAGEMSVWLPVSTLGR